jgi:hypothetical protein
MSDDPITPGDGAPAPEAHPGPEPAPLDAADTTPAPAAAEPVAPPLSDATAPAAPTLAPAQPSAGAQALYGRLISASATPTPGALAGAPPPPAPPRPVTPVAAVPSPAVPGPAAPPAAPVPAPNDAAVPQPGWAPPPGYSPTPVHPAVAPAPPALNAADIEGWFWCPNDLIASEKEGDCPNCGQRYQPAPPWGIPAGPYRPRISEYHRGTKEKVAYFTAGFMLSAVAVATFLGLFLLYRHGTPLDANGLPVTTDTATVSGAGGTISSGGGADTSTSRLQLRSLEGKNLVLTGQWKQTTQVYTVMIDLAKALTANNTQPPLDIAAAKGTSTIAVFNVPSTNPAKTISDNSQTTSDSSSDTGGSITVDASKPVTVDGKASNYTDITRLDATGKPVLALRIYLIPTADHVVMIAVGTMGSTDDILAVSQAIAAL